MAEIITTNGPRRVDYMARDYDSLLQAMRELIPDKLPEWTDYTSEADFGNVLLQLFAEMGDILSYYQDRIANESFLGTAQTRRSIIHHLRLIGYTLSTAAPAAASLTLSVPKENCEKSITISQGNAFSTASQPDRDSVRFEYTSETPLVIICAELPEDPADPNRKIYTAGIPVEEGQWIRDEVLGTSDGRPNQRFTLARAGVIVRSFGTVRSGVQDIVLVSVNESDPTLEQPWTLRETLAFSRNQKDFVVEIDEQDRATVIFGDGDFGAIPQVGSTIKASYRVGGGAFGNVAANTIRTIVDAPQLQGAWVNNPLVASGGADRESIEHAVRSAPLVFRSLQRAVTADDYVALTLNFNGVAKVRAQATGWNTVTLYIAPKGGGRVSDTLANDLLAYFEDKRPLTTQIEIADVDFVEIYVTATIGVTAYYAPDDVKAQVSAVVTGLLDLSNVEFAKTVYLSKFYEAIESIAGVEFVNISEFRRDKQKAMVEERGKIDLGPNELPTVPEDPEYAGGLKLKLEGT